MRYIQKRLIVYCIDRSIIISVFLTGARHGEGGWSNRKLLSCWLATRLMAKNRLLAVFKPRMT